MINTQYNNPFEAIYGKGSDADVALIKSNLLIAITQHLREKYVGMSQKEVSKIIGVSPSELSRLLNGGVSSITIDKLLKLLLSLGFRTTHSLTLNEESQVSQFQLNVTQ